MIVDGKDIKLDLDDLLMEAVQMGGTDLHISVGMRPRVRVHGTLMDMRGKPIVTPQIATNLLLTKGVKLADTKAQAQLNTTGQIDASYSLKKERFRVNIFKQKGDLAAVFRLLNENVPEFNSLGLPVSIFNLYKKRRGLILVVGPTGSGKSTTLAALIDQINRNLPKHIITLEEPIEYIHWHQLSVINQREIGTDCDTFASGLRAALREDPDVILVGEMRDFETAETALNAAETGHLVCSTLHTLGAAETINRIVALYPTGEQALALSQMESILEAVVSQQLLPRADDTGYVVAYEIMFKTKKIKEFLRKRDIDGIEEYLKTDEARAEGMQAMDDTIADLYLNNIITRDVAESYAFDKKDLISKIT